MTTYPTGDSNPLTGEWLLVSPHRTQRPWNGQIEEPDNTQLPADDKGCDPRPTNTRAGGNKLRLSRHLRFHQRLCRAAARGCPASDSHRHVPPVSLRAGKPELLGNRLFTPARSEHGPAGTGGGIVGHRLLDQEMATRCTQTHIVHVQIFENLGALMGCSNPHPHYLGQSIPTYHCRPAKAPRQQHYLEQHKCCLLCTYLEEEIKTEQDRLAELFLCWCWFWYCVVWPFETMIIPRRHAGSIASLSAEERLDPADIMIGLGIRYDNLFTSSFPHSMGIHQQPTDGAYYPGWHYHIHYLPPLLNSRSTQTWSVMSRRPWPSVI